MGAKLQLTRANDADLSRSPERRALAAAMEQHQTVLRTLAAVQSAQRAAFDKIVEAREKLEKVTEDIEKAKVNAARQMTAQAMGTAKGPAPMSVREARAIAQNAQDELDAARDAKQALDKEYEAIEFRLAMSRMTLDNRMREVVRSEASTAKLLADHSELQRNLVDQNLPKIHDDQRCG